jgi:hypothetical protein
VVEPVDGPLQVWIFQDRDEAGISVSRPKGEPKTFADAEIRGVYAVRFRGD